MDMTDLIEADAIGDARVPPPIPALLIALSTLFLHVSGTAIPPTAGPGSLREMLGLLPGQRLLDGGRLMLTSLLQVGPTFWKRVLEQQSAVLLLLPDNIRRPATLVESVAMRLPQVLRYEVCRGRLGRAIPLGGGANGDGLPRREAHVAGASLRSDATGSAFAVEIAVYVAIWALGGSACEHWSAGDYIPFRCAWGSEGFTDAEVLSSSAWIAPLRKRRAPPFAPRAPILLACAVPAPLRRSLQQRNARLELRLVAVGEGEEWEAGINIALCPLRQPMPAPRLAFCTKPLYSMEQHPTFLLQWLRYHVEFGFDAIDVYDLDGSAAPAVRALRRSFAAGAAPRLTHISLFPRGWAELRNLSFGLEVGGLGWTGSRCQKDWQGSAR
mmetsp:Transcript_1334/g.5396  ORF Transcript_1334/g.5396 Transcript_1334/m.5396 type:complete len:384 (-) Transcript_1334:929-2080(-)